MREKYLAAKTTHSKAIINCEHTEKAAGDNETRFTRVKNIILAHFYASFCDVRVCLVLSNRIDPMTSGVMII